MILNFGKISDPNGFKLSIIWFHIINFINKRMNKYLLHLLIIFFLITSAYTGNCNGSDLETIRKRIIAELIEPDVDDGKIETLIYTANKDGSWPEINYQDTTRTGFEHSRHTANFVLMSRAYKDPDSKFYKSVKVKKAIKMALGFWVEHDFLCEGWWNNQIGTPGKLVHTMLLVGDELPEELVEGTQPIIRRATLKRVEGVFYGARPGGDRIKIAGIVAKNNLFNQNRERFGEVVKIIEQEIKFAEGNRGMQEDFSFHHRDDGVNNTLSYGLGYAAAFADWAFYVAGTQYAFSDEPLKHLIDYYLDGICKMLIHGEYPDLGARNRSISRVGALSPMSTEIPEKLLKTSDYRSKELREIVRIRKDEIEPFLSHSKFFWHSEYYSHQRPGWFASVRMFSCRNHNMEVPYRSEGIKNHHLGNGSSFISLTGREYYNIFPVFDWQKIPGTTIMQKPKLPSPAEVQKEGLTDFVGAVTNRRYGVAAFDFKSPYDPLEAKKSWFFFGDEYVCLGAGINCQSDHPVVTTLNQCLLNGVVTAMVDHKKSKITPGAHELKNVQWVFHNGVGYLFPESTSIKLSNQAQKGSWYDISKQSDSPKDEISVDVFKLWIEHGQRPRQGKYQYIVVPATTVQKLGNSKNVNRNIEVIANTPEKQAVKNSESGICQVAFYKAGEIEITPSIKLECNSPGMLMVKTDGDEINEISFADPNRELREIHFSVSTRIEKSGKNFNAVWNDQESVSEIVVDLPQREYAGKSITIEL